VRVIWSLIRATGRMYELYIITHDAASRGDAHDGSLGRLHRLGDQPQHGLSSAEGRGKRHYPHSPRQSPLRYYISSRRAIARILGSSGALTPMVRVCPRTMLPCSAS
jgi:hypothetical protein